MGTVTVGNDILVQGDEHVTSEGTKSTGEKKGSGTAGNGDHTSVVSKCHPGPDLPCLG